MMGWCFLLVLFLTCSCLPSSYGQKSGLFLTLSDAELRTAAGVFTEEFVRKYANTAGYPEVSGTSADISYTFSEWKLKIALAQPDYKFAAPTLIYVGWDQFDFTLTANYHACAKGTVLCSSGHITISTTQSTQLFLLVSAVLEGNPPVGAVVETVLTGGHIDYSVHCTSSACWVPSSELETGLSKSFLGDFTKAITNAANPALEKYLKEKKPRTMFSSKDGLSLDLRSQWFVLAAAPTKALSFVPIFGGFYANISQGKIIHMPPFAPSFTPPNMGTPHGINILITEYFFHSLTWALGDTGFFTRTITASEVPADSPVKLKTNDPTFQQMVPGLTSYPNMDIEVLTTLHQVPNPATATIDVAGIQILNTVLTFQFNLRNQSYSKLGWTLLNTFNVALKVVASISDGGREMMFNASIYNFTCSAQVLSSMVGSIDTDGFAVLYQLLESQIKLPGFVIRMPESITLSNPSTTFYSQFMQIGADYLYKPEPAMLSPLQTKVPVALNA